MWEKHLGLNIGGEEFQPKSGLEVQRAIQQSIVMPLSHFGLIQCSGVDARRFLQGQLSCHLYEVNHHQSRLACYCDHKGRIITTLRVLNNLVDTESPSQTKSLDRDLHNDLLLLLPLAMIQQTIEELKKFAVFSKVELTDLTPQEDILHMGVSGHDAKTVIEQHLQSDQDVIPETINSVSQSPSSGIVCVKLPDACSEPRYHLFGPSKSILSLWDDLFRYATTAAPHVWDLLDIMSGLPSILPQTSGFFTPHQINYPALGGVSFNKGCYRGQEIIARMEYLAKSKGKQQLYRAQLTSSTADSNISPNQPGVGEAIFNSSGKGVGHVVNVAPGFEGGCQLLAVLSRAAVESREPLSVSNGSILPI